VRGQQLVEEGDLEPLGSRWLLKDDEDDMDDMDDMDDHNEDAVLLCEGERENVSIKIVQSEISNDH
jgi:hypothetical protein